jgi:hypothetical protein
LWQRRMAGEGEEEEVYANIILELVEQVCGKEGWPGGKRERWRRSMLI